MYLSGLYIYACIDSTLTHSSKMRYCKNGTNSARLQCFIRKNVRGNPGIVIAKSLREFSGAQPGKTNPEYDVNGFGKIKLPL